MSSERGDFELRAGYMLVIVIAWALFAVFLLTRTLIAAQEIDERVVTINTILDPIDTDLDAVRLAVETNEIATKIADAAEPLSGRLDAVLGTRIVESAASIEQKVNTINDSVLAIGDVAKMLSGNVLAINATARDINSKVTSIRDSADDIEDDIDDTLKTARSIDREVDGINRRADTVISVSGAIGRDFVNIRKTFESIDRHANEIDCTNVPVVKPRGRACDPSEL